MSPAERDENLHEARSPALGNLYRSPTPGERPYVEVGDVVEAGQTLCIVETIESVRKIPDLPADYSGAEMVGVIYEVEAETSGEVVGIPANDGSGVEPGQPLVYLHSEA